MFIGGEEALGTWVSVVMHLLIITSFFAAILAFHNAGARYLLSLGREQLLPVVIAKAHPRMHSPYVAGLSLTLLSLLSMSVQRRSDRRIGLQRSGSGPRHGRP